MAFRKSIIFCIESEVKNIWSELINTCIYIFQTSLGQGKAILHNDYLYDEQRDQVSLRTQNCRFIQR